MNNNYLLDAAKITLNALNSNRTNLVLVVLSSFASAAIDLVSPYFLVEAFASLNEDNDGVDRKDTYAYLGGYCGLWAATHALQSARLIMLSEAGTKVAHTLSAQVLEKYFERPMEYRSTSNTAAEIQHFSNSYEHIGRNFVTSVFAKLLPATVGIMAASSVLTYKYSYMGAYLAGTAVAYTMGIYAGSKLVAASKIEWNEKAFAAFQNLTTRLSQYENTAYYGKQHHELQEFDNALIPLDNAHVKAERVREVVNMLQTALTSAAFLGLLCWSAEKEKAHDISVDDFMWIALYLIYFAQRLNDITSALNQVSESFQSYKDVDDYLKEPHLFSNDDQLPDFKYPDPYLSSPARKPVNITIEFKGVSLKYNDQDKYALTNLNFKINSGETVAFIGESGSGKSSIFQLLLGFYPPTSGTILINGQDISKINRKSLRKIFSVIPQKAYILNQTITDNVAYGGYGGESQEEIDTAIENAWLTKVVQRYGADKPVGEEGKQISGGQRQRISIARALLRNTSVFLGDEITTGLDPNTSRIIMNEFFNASVGKTTLFISHDPHSLTDAVDKVITMDKGSIVEIGDVASLLNKNGLFAKQALAADISTIDSVLRHRTISEDEHNNISIEGDHLGRALPSKMHNGGSREPTLVLNPNEDSGLEQALLKPGGRYFTF